MDANEKPWYIRHLANFVTSVGIALIFVLLWVIVSHREQVGKIVALAGVVLVTDWLDGGIARYFHIESEFGAALDRLRDKFFQLTMFSFFLLDKRVDVLLKVSVCPLALIEIGLLGTLFLGMWKKKEVKAGNWGKAKMALMSAGIIALLVVILVKESGMKIPYYNFVVYVLMCLFVASFGLAIMSFVRHLEAVRD